MTSTSALFAGLCGENSPAHPAPECRDKDTGAEMSCGEPNAVQLWVGLRPGLPEERLPVERDSTQWTSTTIPGFGSGHELFHSLDIVGNRLYVAYNAGLQAWNINGNLAEDPQRLAIADGWRGDFFTPFQTGKNDFLIDDVAAVSLGGNQNLIALSGRQGVGLSVWKHTGASTTFEQRYQDPATSVRRLRIAEHNERLYAFAGGTFGVFVYDLSETLEGFPCRDSAGTICPGAYRGRVTTQVSSVYVDIIQRDGTIYVANSSGIGFPLQIWEVGDPAFPSDPETTKLKYAGLGGALGEAFFEIEGVFYLAVVEWINTSWRIQIYDVTSCLDDDGCSTLPEVWSTALEQEGATRLLTYSTSNGKPFLYYGTQAASLGGTKVEQLLDLSQFPASVREITDDPGGADRTYFDKDCKDSEVDYWGDYYPSNGNGLRNVSPRVGKFKDKYFYRAAFGILDVHVLRDAIFSDPFESGDVSRWSCVNEGCR